MVQDIIGSGLEYMGVLLLTIAGSEGCEKLSFLRVVFEGEVSLLANVVDED